MTPYNPNARCAKCAHDVISTRFVGGIARPDMLHRQCARCGFGWNESPLDASNSDRAQVAAFERAAHAGTTGFTSQK